MKKIFSLFVMMLVVLGAQAINKNVDLSSPTETNCSWNSGTGVVTFTKGTAGNVLFAVSGVDNYTSMSINFTAKTGDNVRVFLVGTNGAYNINGGKDTNLFGNAGVKTLNVNVTSTIGSITGVRVQNLSTDANAAVWTIGSITFNNIENTNTTDFNKLPTGGSWTNNSLISLPFSVSGTNSSGTGWGTILVGYDSGVSNYADISNYDGIVFKIEDLSANGGKIRAFVCKEGDASFTTLYGYHIDEKSPVYSTEKNYSKEGYHYIAFGEYTRLVGLKTNTPGTSTSWKLTECYLVKKTLRINDGVDAGTMVYDPKGATVAYNRSFTKDHKSTVCLPFALTKEEVSAAGTFYELTDYDGSTLTFSPVTKTVAYKPYLFEANATGTPFSSLTNKEIVASSGAITEYTTDDNNGFTATFHGTLNHQGVNGKYGWDSSNGKFSIATTDDVTIDAFRAYITVSGVSGARSLRAVFDDEITEINEVKTQKKVEDGVMYNLSGQRVDASYKGIVVKNGKKYYNK